MERASISLTPRQIEDYANWKWRLSNLYWIVNDSGEIIKFQPNIEQLELFHKLWYLNLILKARQLGFTTAIDLLALDRCLFNSNQTASIIAHRLEDAKKIFRNKIKFPYEHMPDVIRAARTTETETSWELTFDNNSSISVSTSARSGTVNFLHVSEYGYICAKHPDKAEEIKTGALNAVAAGQYVFIESTAYGKAGDFYDKTMKAQQLAQERGRLTELDFKFFFFPWYLKAGYAINPEGVPIPSNYRDYFKRLRDEHDIKLTPRQQAWYVKKAEQMGDKMKREFPTTWEEAFEVAIEGAYYARQMAWLRKQGRIGKVPHTIGEPVNTFWDLGRNDANAIWFHQFIAGQHRFIDYYENSGEDLAHYYKILQDRADGPDGYLYGRHYLPHDADNENLERGESRVDRLVELGMSSDRIVVVERVEDINTGIELTRQFLPKCWFDKEHCVEGIAGLDNYRKEWNDKQATWRDRPLHDWASNPADAFRQAAQGWAAPPRTSTKKRRNKNWRIA